jgi:signal transduction histidine kinase
MVLHGGTVDGERDLGKGTRFTLFFPAASAEAPANLTKM